jgi:hypothetical protein
VQLPVLDQLGGQVANDVAEQLSVQAVADFGNCTACQLGGISKVLPVNGTAKFDQLQLLARPGSNQSITFKLLSATEGVELPGSRQIVRVQLPSCRWGQATTAVGCYNCTSPLFSFSYSSSKCSICPENAAYCSGTSLLPDSGYWNSGPLSTRMHKCPHRNACLRWVLILVCWRGFLWLWCVERAAPLLGLVSCTLLLPDSGYWNSGPLSTRMHKCPRRNACLRWVIFCRLVTCGFSHILRWYEQKLYTFTCGVSGEGCNSAWTGACTLLQHVDLCPRRTACLRWVQTLSHMWVQSPSWKLSATPTNTLSTRDRKELVWYVSFHCWGVWRGMHLCPGVVYFSTAVVPVLCCCLKVVLVVPCVGRHVWPMQCLQRHAG